MLHVSIAGGRKSMGFFAGYAFSLFGRTQDRLSHVLVNDPFESFPDFYFPQNHTKSMA
jgi:CRISPR-associated protein (TIGR02584 family)